MNFLLSYRWLKEFVKTDESPERLARVLSLSGPSVERMKNMGEILNGIVVGKVVTSEKHPNADRLTVNTVDVGGKTVQIICGAPNVRVGMLAAVALPGAKVRWHGEGEFVTLTATKIRGVESFGMMCAGGEIGLEKYPGDGIMDISFTNEKSGTSLAKALDMDDAVFDIEVTSNRPDVMSVVGLAREAAVITKAKFLYKEQTDFYSSSERSESRSDRGSSRQARTVDFSVSISDKKLCPRFSGIVIDGIRVGPSPWWMQKRLLLAGFRPINNIVDITNYVMLEQGKPLHAFDVARLSPLLGGEGEGEVAIVVRRAKKGEKLQALDGKTYELADSMLVIADTENPAAIAGVMGGEKTGVTEKTTRIVFESAVFDPVSIRKTARALHLHSEASNLFEKGLSTESALPALARAVELTLQIAGGHVASKLSDVATKQPKPKPITIDGATVKRFLGVDLPQKEVTRILTSLGFEVKVKKLPVTNYQLLVTSPWYRTDVTMDQDLVEEIARIYGYHRLPSALPASTLVVQNSDDRKEFVWERRVKELFRGAGFTETISYSFVSEQLLKNVDLDPNAWIRVANPLSDDHVIMRPSLNPSLFQVVAENQSVDGTLHLFELARVYRPSEKQAVSNEPLRLAGVVMGVQSFREAKGMAENILRAMGLNDFTYAAYTRENSWSDPEKTQMIMVRGIKAGLVSIPLMKTLDRFGIKHPIAMFHLRFQELVRLASDVKRYTPSPKYPPVLRDLAFVFLKTTAYADVAALLQKNPLVVHVELFDLYEGAQVGEGKKSMAFHLRYQSPDRTLTAEEVDRTEAAIVREVEKQFGAKLRDM